MASTNNYGTDITPLLGQYYEKKTFERRGFTLGVMKWADRLVIPKHSGQVANFNRIQHFGLGERVTDGNDPASPIAADADAIIVQMGILASVIRIPKFGDAIRTIELGKEAYPLFEVQEDRTVWGNADIGLRRAIHGGSAALTGLSSSSFSGFQTIYAGGAANLAELHANQTKLTDNDLTAATTLLRFNGAIPFANGRFACVYSPNAEGDLMVNEGFKTLLSRGDYVSLKNGKFPVWAGCFLDNCDMPFREQSSGTEDTFVSTGNVISTYVFGRHAVAYAEIEGNGGKKFKTQDISTIGSMMTIGWGRWIAPAVKNSTWGVCIKSISKSLGASL